jgi:hypothetical protein
MNASRAANRVEVTLGGKGVTSRVGLVVVAELADRLGLTKAMSAAMSPIVKRRRRRDPGVALAHVALLLADGGDVVGARALHGPSVRTPCSQAVESADEACSLSSRNGSVDDGRALPSGRYSRLPERERCRPDAPSSRVSSF